MKINQVNYSPQGNREVIAWYLQMVLSILNHNQWFIPDQQANIQQYSILRTFKFF